MNCKKSSWLGQSWKWKREITNNNNNDNNNNNRGIFQGDSLYHCFLCCTWINHLLFIDDLKLFGKSYEQIDSLVQTVHTFTMDIVQVQVHLFTLIQSQYNNKEKKGRSKKQSWLYIECIQAFELATTTEQLQLGGGYTVLKKTI